MSTKNVKIAVDTKLLTGEMKIKMGKRKIIGLTILSLFFMATLVGFVYGLLKVNSEFILMGGLGLFCSTYVLLISPSVQNSKNFYIEFPSENSLTDFKFLYKNKLTNIDHKLGNDGKIAFSDNNNKLSCISYVDGSRMRNITKYRIINYFTRWAEENKLISNEVTTTFEQ